VRSTIKYLLDTSALYPLVLKVREKLLFYTELFAILDLTIYEIGNVVWREYRKGRITDPVSVSRMFEVVVGNIEKLSINEEVCRVQEIAIENNLTFYDAAYIYVTRKNKLKLVTEDKVLLNLPESIDLNNLLKELDLLN